MMHYKTVDTNKNVTLKPVFTPNDCMTNYTAYSDSRTINASCPETIANERSLTLIAEGIADTLREEVSVKKQEANNLLNKSITSHKGYMKLNELLIKGLELERVPKLFYSRNKELEQVRIEAFKTFLEINPMGYVYGELTIANMRDRTETFLREEATKDIKCAPSRDQIKALIMLEPEYLTTSFTTRLNLARKTFM